MIIKMVIFYYVNDDFSLSRWCFFAKWMMIFHHVTSNNMVKFIIYSVKNHYLMIKNYHLHDDEWSNFSRLRRLINRRIWISKKVINFGWHYLKKKRSIRLIWLILHTNIMSRIVDNWKLTLSIIISWIVLFVHKNYKLDC